MKKVLLISLLLLTSIFAKSQISMPSIFSDNMILQRDTIVNVWGWAAKNEKISLIFDNKTYTAKANTSGEWIVRLPAMNHGGPYKMTISGAKNSIEIQNILIGDVWLCSGQSNMEWRVHSVNNASAEIAMANYPMIRSFNVAQEIGLELRNDLNGKWEICSPATVSDFSAVAYFFARKLHEDTNIPIAIINSSWGGTDIETWISAKTFDTLPERFKTRYVNSDFKNKFSPDSNKKAKTAYEEALNHDLGLSEKWYTDNYKSDDWSDIKVPAYWHTTPLNDPIGIVWFKQTFELDELPKQKSIIFLGPIDDEDIVWINGVEVGSTKIYNAPRIYNIPLEALRKGNNTITVRVYNSQGGGGIYGKADDLFVQADDIKIKIDGIWKHKASVVNHQFGYVLETPNALNSLLFNSMINPLTKLSMKGAIWYQGENNASNAYDYRTLFPTMIKDWRTSWGYIFPFYWVQLANFMQADAQPAESEWAELREAQTMTLSLEKTGQAVITDIGDANDIHPRNKQDVGLRLALITLNKDYGKSNMIYTAPTYKFMEIKGNKIIITLDNHDSGINIHNKYGYIQGFSIAGENKDFVWAKAYIENNKLIVYSNDIADPIAVRYNWANNPDGNIFSKEGLPMAPFRTDNWKMITEHFNQ